MELKATITLTIVGAIITLAGIIGLILYFAKEKKLKNYIDILATIVEHIKGSTSGGKGRSVYFPVWEYTYKNQIYRYEDTVGSTGRERQGYTQFIKINPLNPKEAYTMSERSFLKAIWIFLFYFGFILFSIVLTFSPVNQIVRTIFAGTIFIAFGSMFIVLPTILENIKTIRVLIKQFFPFVIIGILIALIGVGMIIFKLI